MDYIELSPETIEAIAMKTAKELVRELKKQEVMKERGMVPLKEAASILGISVNHLREIKDKFPYVKYGKGKYGRLFFKKDDLNPVMASLMSEPQ